MVAYSPGPEWIVVLVVLVLLFGAKKLPELARSVGKSTNEFKKGMSEGARIRRPEERVRRTAAEPRPGPPCRSPRPSERPTRCKRTPRARVFMTAMDEALPLSAHPLPAEQADDAFGRFFEEHHERLHAALWLVARDGHEAEEIAQDAFLKVWERWDRVGGIEDPAGYLFRTAMNLLSEPPPAGGRRAAAADPPGAGERSARGDRGSRPGRPRPRDPHATAASGPRPHGPAGHVLGGGGEGARRPATDGAGARGPSAHRPPRPDRRQR